MGISFTFAGASQLQRGATKDQFVCKKEEKAVSRGERLVSAEGGMGPLRTR